MFFAYGSLLDRNAPPHCILHDHTTTIIITCIGSDASHVPSPMIIIIIITIREAVHRLSQSTQINTNGVALLEICAEHITTIGYGSYQTNVKATPKNIHTYIHLFICARARACVCVCTHKT